MSARILPRCWADVQMPDVRRANSAMHWIVICIFKHVHVSKHVVGRFLSIAINDRTGEDIFFPTYNAEGFVNIHYAVPHVL